MDLTAEEKDRIEEYAQSIKDGVASAPLEAARRIARFSVLFNRVSSELDDLSKELIEAQSLLRKVMSGGKLSENDGCKGAS